MLFKSKKNIVSFFVVILLFIFVFFLYVYLRENQKTEYQKEINRIVLENGAGLEDF